MLVNTFITSHNYFCQFTIFKGNENEGNYDNTTKLCFTTTFHFFSNVAPKFLLGSQN